MKTQPFIYYANWTFHLNIIIIFFIYVCVCVCVFGIFFYRECIPYSAWRQPISGVRNYEE